MNAAAGPYRRVPEVDGWIEEHFSEQELRAHRSGTVECWACAGTGSLDCEGCEGTGQQLCRDCEGSGTDVCEDCGGKGVLA